MTRDIPAGILERQPVPPEHRWALEYLATAADETSIKKRREALRDNLKEWIIENGEPDENGNLIYYFPSPIVLENSEVRGLMAQRRTSEFVNEDTAFAIAEKYGVTDQVVETEVIEELNLDKMYVLNQQGVISDEDIDSIIEIKETFALVKVD